LIKASRLSAGKEQTVPRSMETNGDPVDLRILEPRPE